MLAMSHPHSQVGTNIFSTPMAPNANSLPLYEKISLKYPLYRVFDITILLLLISALAYRLLTLKQHGFAWHLAFLCESWFTFIWILTITIKWNPTEFKAYPERLSLRAEELPRVDMFVTTADPELEPPIITVNTVISLLAVDYPAEKLACYVSDDGCSALTYYSLVEASKFGKLWVPFCKKYNVQVRAPFRYFSTECTSPRDASLEFQREWRKMRDEYEELSHKIRLGEAEQQSILSGLSPGDLASFSNVQRINHPTIIKVILENKRRSSDGLPHLIYISREKLPKHPHRYKAGAMNVLTRVSGLMTNAPFMLNVDCDMFVNDPQIIRYAMCLFHGSKKERECGFVQFPQDFYDGLKDDPFGNQLVVLQKYAGRGVAGLQGVFYGGTGCFHMRKVIYGMCPDDIGNEEAARLTPVNANLDDKELQRLFGNSKDLTSLVGQALQGKINGPKNLSELIEVANHVAASGYEYNTSWGSEIGWRYGSTTEDVLTGLSIHARGWMSVCCTPSPPAFLGCAPSGGPASLTQQKRWATGLLEILVSKKSPIIATFKDKLQFRQCLAYLWLLLWGLRSIPELCYAILPAYCIITNSSFLPKVQEPTICIYVALLTSYMVYYVVEYLGARLSIRAWWNNQRMARIIAMDAWFFGMLGVLLKILGLSETVFEVTQKDQSNDGGGGGDLGRFTFDHSPIFVPGTALLLLQLTSMVMVVLGLQKPTIHDDGYGPGLGEIVVNTLVVMCFWPFFNGLFRKGKYGIPLSTICMSALLTFLFVYLCRKTSMG